MPYKTIYLVGGINRNVSTFLNQDGELSDIQNFELSKIGVLKKSGGYSLKNAQVTALMNILGGFDFQRADGTNEHFIAVDGANAGIYKDVGGTWTDQSQTLTSGAYVRFAYSPVLDVLFACNYSDATRSYNGTSWSTSTNVTDAPKAKYITSFGDRIYLLNCVVGATSYVSRAYRSTTTDTSPITWDADEWISFNDVITGVGKVGENMFVGCDSSCWVWTLEEVKYQASGRGCVSHDGIVSYGNSVFFPSDDGMYLYDGSKDINISLAVKDYWDAIPVANRVYIKAKMKGHHLYISIGDVVVDGRSLSNVILDYNVLQNTWSRFSIGEDVMEMHTFTESTGEEIFIGNNNGEVFQLFGTNTDQDGSVFTSFIETPWYYGSGPREIDDFTELWAYGEDLSGLKVKYKIDNKGWISAGELNSSSDFVNISTSGKRIKFLLEETSKGNMYELHALDIGYQPKFPERDEKKE
jgi:hypothetical protein